MASTRYPLTGPVATTFAVLALVGLLPPPAASAQGEYEFVLVEAFNENYDLREVYLRDINEMGVACGTSTYESSYAGFSWTRESEKELLPITWVRGINDLNQVVGDNRMYDIGTGQSVTIPPAAGYPLTRVRGINDNGLVVGYAECECSNSDGIAQTALVWDPVNGSRATGVTAARELLRINDSNVAVGNIRPSAGSSEAFVYDVDSGAHTNLSDLLPDPPFGRPWSEAADINESGEVCGQGYDGTTVPGMIWSPIDGFTFLPGLDGGDPTRVYPMGMNDHGVVVGRALSGTSGDWDGFIWDPANGMRNLDDLIDGAGAFTTDWAVEINEQGWIVGIGHYGPGWNTARGFVLVPLRTTDAPDAPTATVFRLRATPNPASSNVEIEYSAAVTGDPNLMVFDATGRMVAILRGDDRTGSEGLRWAWSIPRDLSAGVYSLRLGRGRAGVVTGRLVLTR